ncbi:PAS domain-containing hybrid sensor histidine kinase/response regulator [Jiulongibacter sediminis]|uniref:Sensory/regulatory protein RpfC n=1 Tax=Jiulongibacter sediminis TaxID=1605367 RepID=A0A0N8H9G5_9BACT|nr:hybrid sensor histidine kinase/response regulator [Jiulongibacter sediminis]KPM47308.1 histidine kinase [Jiulongibacter sediminis]TBX22866.1 histidine kinase [Jiulongibacter sediminis]
MSYNSLLQRQIQKLWPNGPESLTQEDITKFLQDVSNTYDSLEKARNMADRAFEISENEYQEVNVRLSRELDKKELSIKSLVDAVNEISEVKVDVIDQDIVGLANLINEEIKNRKSAESVLTSLITNLKNGILLEDRNRIIRFSNQNFCDIFKIPSPDLIQGQDCSNTAQDVKHFFKDPESFAAHVEKCVESKELILAENFELADGRSFLLDYIPVYLENIYDGHLWSYTEITENRKKELAIAENERKNRLIMNAALDAIITIDKKSLVNFWNPQAEKIFGWSVEEAVGKPLHQLIIPRVHHEGHRKGMENFISSGHGPVLNKQIELPALHKDGHEISIELYILPIGQGEDMFFCSFIRDITERKHILEEKERLSLVASANENGVVFVNNNERIVWCNEGFKRMTGYSETEILEGIPLEMFIGPKTNQEELLSLLKYFHEGASISTEIILYRKDGSSFWVRAKGQNLAGAENYFFMLEDITQEKETQTRLKEYDEKLKIALNNVGDNYWEHDFVSDETVFLSPGDKFLGFEPGEIGDDKASFWWSRVHPDDLAILDNLDNEYKNKKRKRHNCEYRIIQKDGSIQWVIDRGVVIEFDENDRPLRIIGTHIDISEQKKLERELIEAKEIAESSTKAKEIFLANMSHEMRTPMNAIVGMANQLKKTALNENQEFYTNTIGSSADNLLVIINDILDLSKIEAGELTIEQIGFEPSKVIGSVMQSMMYRAEEKGLYFINSYCDLRLAPILIGDPYRINQIFLNLISNAIKFTHKGGIDVQCHVTEDNDSTQIVEGRVIDTGIGMDPAFKDRIFQKFKQEDDSVTRKFGGTGLGMSICKELVELMGGEIGVESEKGKGTMVYFRIPMTKGSESDLPRKEKKDFDSSLLDNKTILVTDDNEMNRLVASTILKNYNVNVLEANDGLECIEMIRTHQPDLVLMDVQMPNMDGLEATRLIRSEISKTLPVIALTALALKGEEVKFREAGMNDYVLKPFQEESLLEVICDLIESPSKEITEESHGRSIASDQLFSLENLQSIGDEAFVKRMADMFVNLSQQNMKEMKEAYRVGDFVRLGKLAHKIKPSLDNMAIHSLTNIIRDVEKNAVNYGKSEQLEGLLEEIEGVLNKVIEELKKR